MYINPVIYSGRPDEKRCEKEEAAYRVLDSLGIEYLRMDHDAVDTMEACKDIDRIMDIKAYKNLFLCNKQKNRYFLVVISGDKRFDSKSLSAQLELPRLSFAPPEQMDEMLGLSPGSVSILGVANDRENKVTLIVDSDITAHKYFGCHPCVNTSSLKIKTADIFDKFLPAVNHSPIFYTP